jgi:hypothetical protein
VTAGPPVALADHAEAQPGRLKPRRGERRAYRNHNRIQTRGFSNPASEKAYRLRWPGDPRAAALYGRSAHCLSCSFYAVFNSDWGLCCNPLSAQYLETIFEHFTCRMQVDEGESHSFHWEPRT